MKLTSTAFADGEKLPKEFAKMGANRIPPLKIEGVPENAKSLTLIMHDPDAPCAGGFYHWTLWNIPPETTAIGDGTVPRGAVEERRTGVRAATTGRSRRSVRIAISFTSMRLTRRSIFAQAATSKRSKMRSPDTKSKAHRSPVCSARWIISENSFTRAIESTYFDAKRRGIKSSVRIKNAASLSVKQNAAFFFMTVSIRAEKAVSCYKLSASTPIFDILL